MGAESRSPRALEPWTASTRYPTQKQLLRVRAEHAAHRTDAPVLPSCAAAASLDSRGQSPGRHQHATQPGSSCSGSERNLSSQDRCPGATVSRCTPWRRWKPHPPQRDRSSARELVRDRDGHPRREQHPLPNSEQLLRVRAEHAAHRTDAPVLPSCAAAASLDSRGQSPGRHQHATQPGSSCSGSERNLSSQDRCPGATVSRCTPWRRWKPHPPQRDRSSARELVRDRDGHPRREQHPLPISEQLLRARAERTASQDRCPGAPVSRCTPWRKAAASAAAGPEQCSGISAEP